MTDNLPPVLNCNCSICQDRRSRMNKLAVRNLHRWTAEELVTLTGDGKVEPFIFNRLPKLEGPATVKFEVLKAWSRENPDYTAIAASVAAENARQEKAVAEFVRVFPTTLKPLPWPITMPNTPPTSGREIAIRQKEAVTALDAEFRRRCDWAIAVGRSVWPQAEWEVETDFVQYTNAPRLRWRLLNDYALEERGTDAIMLLPALDEPALRRCIYRQREMFFDAYKMQTNRDRKVDSCFEMGTFESLKFFCPLEPADHIERAFALPLAHDSDELHDRLFVGPRAGMEDQRHG